MSKDQWLNSSERKVLLAALQECDRVLEDIEALFKLASGPKDREWFDMKRAYIRDALSGELV